MKLETAATINGDGSEEVKAYTRSQGPITEEQTDETMEDIEAERLERKENLRKKQKAYMKEVRKSQSISAVQPIGTDRLYRRYWIFHCVNGLFIEDNDPYLSQLLRPHDDRNEVRLHIHYFMLP